MTATVKGDGQPQLNVRALPPQPRLDGSDDTPPPLPEVPGDGILTFDPSATEEEHRSVLFRIRDGKGGVTEYTVWDNPPATLGLQYLDEARRFGPNLALAWLMDQMLGAESYEAFKACRYVTRAGLQRVAEVCVEKAMATLGPEPPKEQD